MTSRDTIEFVARGSAGTIFERDNLTWCRVLNRFEMYVNRNDKSVSPHLINDGFWESWITKWVMDNVDNTTFFIDIGANTGYYSFLAESLGATVVAFEPNSIYSEMMRSTINRSGSKAIYVYEEALSNYWGEASLNIPTELHGSASLNEIIPGYATTQQTVQVRRLDDVLHHRSDFEQAIIKIDAEGEEERILEGAREFLDKTPNVTVLLEYTPHAYSRDFVDNLFDTWIVTTIDSNGNEQRIIPQWLEAQTDWVMLVLR